MATSSTSIRWCCTCARSAEPRRGAAATGPVPGSGSGHVSGEQPARGGTGFPRHLHAAKHARQLFLALLRSEQFEMLEVLLQRPLRKVASGGELSRISLAIEVAALGSDAVPTMVFDEVDSGIGGAVAEIVGQKLRALGASRQVLCVTHLPQVAAQGHAHYRVSKADRDGLTHSAVERLDQKQRQEELARMLGGVEVSREARAAAKRLLAGSGA